MRKITRVGVLVAAAMVFAGCSLFGMRNFKEPVVTFKEARLGGLGITGGSLDVVLDVYNPNGFRLDGSKFTYTVLVDSLKLGEGEYQSRFQVEKGATSEIRLPIRFTYSGLGAAGRELLQTGSVEYTVKGEVTVGTPIGNFTRPYSEKRRFSTMR